MPLNDNQVKHAKPREKEYRLADWRNLYLLVKPNGTKCWRVDYRISKIRRTLALGTYPAVTLKEAREQRDEAMAMIASGIDPCMQKKVRKNNLEESHKQTFEIVGQEWFEKKRENIKKKYAGVVATRLRQYVYPLVGGIPIKDITPLMILELIRKIEKHDKIDTAQRVFNYCSGIMKYGVITSRCERDVTQDIRGALKQPVRRPFKFLKEKELPSYLEKIESTEMSVQTRCALKLMNLTFVRTGELRAAEWGEFHWDKKEWHIPAERMKSKRKHIVPLAKQTIELLEKLKELSFGSEYLFPSLTKEGYMCDGTLLTVYWRMGYKGKATVHGMRKTASTIIAENGFNSEIVDLQLAHAPKNKVKAIYIQAEYLSQRHEIMQWWADHLDHIKEGKTHLRLAA